MASPEQTPAAPRRRPPPRTVEVRNVKKLTPHMVRVTFGGEQMEGFETRGVAEHIRIYLPNQETGEMVLPVLGPEGYAFPEDKQRPSSRAYTPRHWNPETGELDVDIVIHGEGPGSAWAAQVKAGDTAVISGRPGGPYTPEAGMDWYVIGGDEAALPAIGTLVEVLPASLRAQVFVEVLNADEEQPLESASQMEVTWLHRNDESAASGRLLAETLKGIAIPEGEGRIWFSCEAAIMRDLRRHFLEERGLERTMLRSQGYWLAGETNHSDSDMGDDV